MINSQRRRRVDILVVLLLTGAAFLFMLKAMLPEPGKILYGYDVYQLFHPFLDFMFAALRRGELPLWNPNFFLGFPQYAEPQLSTFYPLTWPLAWLPETLVFPVQYAVHFAWAGIGGYFLVLRLGGRRAGALIAALVFAYMVTMTSRIDVGHLPHMMTFAWTPWCLLAAHWAAEKGTWAATVTAGVPLAMAFLIGYLPFLILTVPLMIIFMAWLAIIQWRAGQPHRATRIVVQLAGLGLFAALLASIQLLPAAEFTLHSNRATGQYEGVHYPFETPYLLTALMPDLFGAPFGTQEVLLWLDRPDFIYWEWAIYVGILPLILFLLTWGVGRKEWRFWVIFGLLGLLLAMGDPGVFYRLLYDYVPGISWFRFISRPVYYFNLAAAICAGLMFDHWFSLPRERHDRFARVLKKALWIGLVLGLILLLLSLATPSLATTDRAESAASFISVQLLRLLILFALSMALLIWGYGRNHLLISGLAVILVAADLWSAGYKFMFFIDNLPEWGWQQADLFLPPNRDEYRVLPTAISENHGYFYGFQSIYGYDGFTLQTSEVMRQLAATDSRVVSLLSGQYYLHGSWWEEHVLTPGWEKMEGPEQVTIYQRHDALPRAFMVHDVIGVESPEQALDLMSDQSIDFGRTALVEITPGTSCAIDPLPVGSAGDQVAITRYGGNEVAINVTSAAAGWLVLNDLIYTGWSATIDGQPVTIQPTNYALRGVCIPAGSHEVVFSFQPAILRWGAALTGMALLLLLLALLSLWRAGRRETRSLSHTFPVSPPSEEDHRK